MPEPVWPKGLWEGLSLCLLPGCFNPVENEAQDLSYVCAAIQHFHKGKIQNRTIPGNVVSAELRFCLKGVLARTGWMGIFHILTRF